MNTTELKSKLTKSAEFLQTELSQIRTGRANTSLIEDLKVDAYGTLMSLKELGSITVQDAQNIIVSPWDKGMLGAISKAIRESDLNLNPSDDAERVRVPIPALTEERRKELTKLVSTKLEEAKNSMRNIRQEAMKDIDKAFSDKAISEDEKFTQREEVEEICKEFISQVESSADSKKDELMTV